MILGGGGGEQAGSMNPPRAVDKMSVCVQFLAHRVHNFYHILRHSGFPKTGQALAVLGRISLKWEPVPGPLRQG